MRTIVSSLFLPQGWLIWAQAKGAAAAKPPATSWFWTVVLGLGVVVGTFVVLYLRKDVSTTDEGPSVTDEEQLAEFERAYEAGEMDEAEIRKVRAALRLKMGIAPLPSSPDPELSPEPVVGPTDETTTP